MPGYTVSQTTSVDTTTTSTSTVFTTTTTTTTIRVTPTFTAPSRPVRRSERDSDKAEGNGDNARKESDDGKKENDNDKPLPSYCAQYPKPRVSSACSCLSIPPLTTTTTSTITVTSPTPATTVVQTKFNTIVATSTTTSTITSTATSTTTICPAPTQTPGANGIGLVSQNAQIQVPTTSGGNDCCLYCFDPSRSSNCAAFAGGPGFCFIAVSDVGGSNPSPMCPAGRVGAIVLVDSTQAGTGSIGGAGPCAGPGFAFG